MAIRTRYPLSAVRSLALHSQGLDQSNAADAHPGPAEILAAVQRIRAVQLDTLQMVHRSQNLVLWSRLGTYDPADFERLIYNPQDRRLYEGWLHAACILMLDDYRYDLTRTLGARQSERPWYLNWISKPENAELMQLVLERVRLEGALRAQDFGNDGHQRGAWWDWKPAKVALELHFMFGHFMVSKRIHFQRVYDLTERVLPAWVDTRVPDPAELQRFWVETGVRTLGICRPDQAAIFTNRLLTPTRQAVRDLLAASLLSKVPVELLDGQTYELLIHRDNLSLLEQAADGALPAQRTTFLSFFDSLFWARGRDEEVWGFRNMLEAYVPAPKRIYGYFCMPILHKDRLVGRFDPKLERKTGTLRIKALYLEPGVEPGEQLASDLAVAMRDFMKFHNAHNLVIERSQPHGFGEQVVSLL
jgi:hypothetical protein